MGSAAVDRAPGQDEQTNSGVTDTKGNKKEASGHVTDSMLSVYDHSLPTVSESGAN